ncbi:hypothetical protein BX070DRAFT_251407 [Coemansia spiralis]|nr:hypothetical protein BX070DRAFT_251407 [Coemansia spiralis]
MSVRFSALSSSDIKASRISKTWTRRERDFSYSTLVGTEEFTTIQTYFADDIGYTFSVVDQTEREQKQHPRLVLEPLCDDEDKIDDACSDTDVTILSGDIPRIEGKSRRLRRNARRQLAVAMAKARNGWINFLYRFSWMKRRGKPVVVQPKYFP